MNESKLEGNTVAAKRLTKSRLVLKSFGLNQLLCTMYMTRQAESFDMFTIYYCILITVMSTYMYMYFCFAFTSDWMRSWCNFSFLSEECHMGMQNQSLYLLILVQKMLCKSHRNSISLHHLWIPGPQLFHPCSNILFRNSMPIHYCFKIIFQ